MTQVLALTARDWAMVALLAAAALVLFVIAVVISNLYNVVSSINRMVRGITDETLPVINEVGGTVRGVNKQLERADAITGSIQRVVQNVEIISETVQATVTNPLVKALAFFAGARRAGRKMRKQDD
ncbi:MAG TPA: DUF948 domain-containing protein [Actinomycetota bacterium]